MEHVTLENRVHPLYYTFRRNPRLFQLYGIICTCTKQTKGHNNSTGAQRCIKWFRIAQVYMEGEQKIARFDHSSLLLFVVGILV